LEKSNIEAETIKEMKNLKNALENIKEDDTQKTQFQNIENTFIEDKPSDQEIPTEQKEEAKKEDEKPIEISGNFDALPETYKTYINKISSKFPDPKKSHIINF
jgi:hypothetical protein